MSMNLERAAMKGRLAELQQHRDRLKLRIEAAARAIRTGLNTTLAPVEELEVPVMDTHWDDLKDAWAELQVVKSDIARLERELR